MEGGSDKLVVELIRRAALAGANSAMAREVPEAARFFETKAAEHSGRVTALAGEMVARTTTQATR